MDYHAEQLFGGGIEDLERDVGINQRRDYNSISMLGTRSRTGGDTTPPRVRRIPEPPPLERRQGNVWTTVPSREGQRFRGAEPTVLFENSTWGYTERNLRRRRHYE